MMNQGRIRPIAIGVIRDRDRIFVYEGYDPLKGETFYRPLGGGIEFGELGADALVREMCEEVGAELTDLCYLGAVENIFTWNGRAGHEIMLVYEGRFTDRSMYERESMEGREDNGETFTALWMPLEDFRQGRFPLYPNELLGMINGEKE
jgi:8-oxo-dGTP pyrophosphatase MutT (NUDIX family)